jgi:DNA repair exonuclease SbcCD ATPase subunit
MGEFINSIEVPTTLLDEDTLIQQLGELDTSSIDEDLAILKEAIAADKPQFEAAKVGLQQWAIYQASQAARTVAQNAKAAFENKPRPDAIPPTTSALTEAEEDLLTMLTERKCILRNSLGQLSGKRTTCGTCGQPLPDAQTVEAKRALLQQEINAVWAQSEPLEIREGQWQKYAQQCVCVETWEAERARVNAAVDVLRSCDAPATSRAELLKVELDYDALASDIKALAATRRNMLADRVRIEQQLAEFRQIRDRTARTREAIAELTATRQVFHHDEAPRMVSYTFVEGMLEEINETLAIFDAPYRVTMDENLGFIANFLDGVRVQPDRRLSVGERIILAMAFRITVNSTFASQVGLLVMDEPTAGFDEHNLGCLPHALNRLKELSEERGLQVLFVTHEPQITNIFDNVIVLPAAQT